MKLKPRAIIVSLLDRTQDIGKQESSLKEAELLVETYGGEVVRVITQNASHMDSGTYIGTGKVVEIANIVKEENIDILVVNAQLKSSHLFNLKNIISPDDNCNIWDRTQLILQIFKSHATTSEAKLQIRLALLNHQGPELSGLGISMSQQAGGIGTKGIGETNTEIMRRHWQKEIKNTKEKLQKVIQTRQQQMKSRKQSGIPTVSIIGYTNAGKTSLFNALCNKGDKVKNALFATLDSSVSSLYLSNLGKKIFITDTIGFIQDLPTTLIDAFKSTLMETTNADLLLHVIDGSDKNLILKINTVSLIIDELNLDTKRQILVINKNDKLSDSKRKDLSKQFKDLEHIFISAKLNKGIDKLTSLIAASLQDMGLKRAKHLDYLNNS